MCKEYLQEYEHYYQDRYITFNIVDIDRDNAKIIVNISDSGRLTLQTFELLNDGDLEYFEFGSPIVEEIYLNDFMEVA